MQADKEVGVEGDEDKAQVNKVKNFVKQWAKHLVKHRMNCLTFLELLLELLTKKFS